MNLKLLFKEKIALKVCCCDLITYSWGHAWRRQPNTEIGFVSTFGSQQLSVNAPQNDTFGVNMLKFKTPSEAHVETWRRFESALNRTRLRVNQWDSGRGAPFCTAQTSKHLKHSVRLWSWRNIQIILRNVMLGYQKSKDLKQVCVDFALHY